MSGHENDKLFNDYQNCVAKMSIEEAFAALKRAEGELKKAVEEQRQAECNLQKLSNRETKRPANSIKDTLNSLEMESIQAADMSTKVSFLIDWDKSDLISGGHIFLKYRFMEGEWQENDMIFLSVEKTLKNDDPMMTQEFYYSQYDCPYEVMEFVEERKPKKNKQAYYTMKFPLPSYGGIFCLYYIREKRIVSAQVIEESKRLKEQLMDDEHDPIDPSNYAKITSRFYDIERHELGVSERFHVPFKVHIGHPDATSHSQTSIRRRGVGMIENNMINMNYCMENLRNIKTILITGSLKCHDSDNHNYNNPMITRVMGWIFRRKEEIMNAAVELCVVLEFDIIYPILHEGHHDDDANKPEPKSMKAYGVFNMRNIFTNNDWLSLSSGSVITGELNNNSMICRLSYHNELSTSSSRYGISNTFEDTSSTKTVIACKYCKNVLLKSSTQLHIKPLPSGMFDNMLHEFICCEDIPCQPMTSSDVYPHENQALVGPIHFCVNTEIVNPDAVETRCKRTSTLLDLFTASGGSLAVTPHQSRISSNDSYSALLSLYNRVVNIDTCLVICKRCELYIGDGNISGDCDNQLCEGAHTQSFNSSGVFSLDQLRDIRFDLSYVEVMMESPEDTHKARKTITTNLIVSTEQCLARSLLHLSNVYGISNYCVFDSDKLFNQTNHVEVIRLQLMNKSYSIGHPLKDGKIELNDAMKITYSYQLAKTSNPRVAEGVVGIPHDVFVQILRNLAIRKIYFLESSFKNQDFSYMLL